MKRILIILGITTASMAYSQGMFILNNYSPHDFHGNLMAMNLNGCIPSVMNNDPATIIVPANANMGNGNAWKIDNYRDQYNTSLYPITSWLVSLSNAPGNIRLWNNPSLMPNGVIADHTKWVTSKFQMYYAGTNNHVVGFNTSVGDATPNLCITSVDYYSTPNGTAEWFTITGTDPITYLQIYP